MGDTEKHEQIKKLQQEVKRLHLELVELQRDVEDIKNRWVGIRGLDGTID